MNIADMSLLKVKTVLFILLAFIVYGQVNGQKNAKLERADNLYGGVDDKGDRYISPVCNVVFKQNETLIY